MCVHFDIFSANCLGYVQIKIDRQNLHVKNMKCTCTTQINHMPIHESMISFMPRYYLIYVINTGGYSLESDCKTDSAN